MSKPNLTATIQWVTVEQELPDDEITVLMADKEGEIWMGCHLDNLWFSDVYKVEGVTHWAHLPEHPTVKA